MIKFTRFISLVLCLTFLCSTISVAADTTQPHLITSKEAFTNNTDSISPKLTTRYFEKDEGFPANYTVSGPVEYVPNIPLNANLGSLTSNAVLSIIGKIGTLSPKVTFTISVAKTLTELYSTATSTNMSCIIRHYYKPGWPNGWYAGNFEEKIVTTWYPQLNYGGVATTTTHYRTGYFY